MIKYSPFIMNLKDEEWLFNQRKAGKVLVSAMNLMLSSVKEGISTYDLNKIAEEYIYDNDGIPAFKGYKGFPAGVCTSINKEVVHGIPKKENILKNGDILKLDSGVSINGAIADMARTIIVGRESNIKHKILYETCKNCLKAAIESIKPGEPNFLGNIGQAIKKEARKINANVVMDLGGHGIEKNFPHWAPFVANDGEKGSGPRLFPGMTIAIEPMITYGKTNITIDKEDKWTITLEDVSCHEENTIFIHNDKVEIITAES